MDQDGLFLMLKMCNGCSHNKGSWKKCMSRRHNPRMSTVREDELTYSHRQCVKPDQAITIYKLHDHETNEDYLEFDEKIIFQTACRMCLNIKSCLREGHKLIDWRPTFAGGRVAGSSHPPPSPPASTPAPTPPPPPPAARGGGSRRGGGGPGRAPRSARGRSASTSVVDDEMEVVEDYGDGGGTGRKVFPAGGRGRRGHAAAAAAAGGAPQESTATRRGPHKRKSPASSAYPRSASSHQLMQLKVCYC
ncbi:hypothetical protein Esi_0042_0144 [Ectocarpus siliculosus]|uniref:Uncharacterized protein n=1 Tax=Ectocarpus siliculosus TaxID=2880 RepID=D7G0U1_ECTSI|nr:hypothetical protein Esi_0042_0144 [Ectocarpus siliculosus]|eukprot:CBJ26754.1 hypothetical protein Esi_0042_0144 [Ectocarpus siliculosus]